MRFIKYLFVIASLSLLLAGCGKSEEAVAVETKIAAIGTVTLDSEGVIEEAKKAYDALEEKQKKYVENAADIQAAEDAYNVLLEEKEAAEDMALAEAYCQRVADVAAALVSKNEICLKAWKWTDDTAYPSTWEEYETLSGKFLKDMGFSKKELESGMAFALDYNMKDIKEHVDGLSFCSFLKNPAKGALVSEYIWGRRQKGAGLVYDMSEVLLQEAEALDAIDASREYIPALKEMNSCVQDYLEAYGDCRAWGGTYVQNLAAKEDFEKVFEEKVSAVKELGFLADYEPTPVVGADAVAEAQDDAVKEVTPLNGEE